MPKKKYNGFYYFMKEMQERENAKGHKYSMADLPSIAHPKWQALSVKEKEPYENMVKQMKNDPGRFVKLASDGTKVEDNYREIEEAEKRRNKMIQDVKRSCNVDCVTFEQFKESAPRKRFYILSFNILCRTSNDEYIPNEVGLVEYSIQHGIHREYHKFFQADEVPTGYAREAKAHSEDYHKIPVHGHAQAERNPMVILNDIELFINPRNEDFPPVFCASKSLELTEGCLKWLAEKTRSHYDYKIFQVLNCTFLLMELRAGVRQGYPSEKLANDDLTKNSFDHHPAARCDFHEDEDCVYCALGYSKRLCYLLSDAVCHLFNVPLTERHIPSRAIEGKDYDILPPATTRRHNAALSASASRGYGRGVQPPSATYNNTAMPRFDSRIPGSMNSLDEFDQPLGQVGRMAEEDFPPLPPTRTPVYEDDNDDDDEENDRHPAMLLQDLKRLGISTTATGRGGFGRGLPRS